MALLQSESSAADLSVMTWLHHLNPDDLTAGFSENEQSPSPSFTGREQKLDTQGAQIPCKCNVGLRYLLPLRMPGESGLCRHN